MGNQLRKIMAELANTCFWYPELPECNPEDAAEEVAPVEKSEPVDDGEETEVGSALYASFLIFMMASFQVAVAAMKQFRWRKEYTGGSDYYSAWADSYGTNYWKLGVQILDYGRLSIYGLFAITEPLVWIISASGPNFLKI